jgi:serine/threonine protein kinase
MTEETLFHEALGKASPQERAAFLDEACAGQPELRAEVEALLAASEQTGSFLAKPAVARALHTPGPNAPDAEAGSVIGPYKLVERIGEGGFGVVYMAEQQHPIRRTVALKVLKPGMDTRRVITRFEMERQALAVMEHANIARVFDGGETPGGRPYFVMELVKGVPITRYCDEHQLTPRERLELFVPVCQAIQHAHQKGIIHRDLKPSNVLTAAYDGRPVPKVIDFGVAKALGQPLTERTLATRFGDIVGTFEYMSPEQAEFNALDIDTRSDIFSLGVLLYELLTGTTPLTKERIEQAAMSEVLRLIREEEAPRPSTRLSDSKETLASISSRRKLEPARLTKELRGELDWIVMKCLDKDRSRRYETASSLAQDIERYLHDDPVEAGPPSAQYRLRKFLRRNRRPMIAATLVLLALLGGMIGTTIGFVRAKQQWTRADAAETVAIKQRDKAISAQNEAMSERDKAAELAETERQTREKAEKRLSQIQKGNEILGSIFKDLNPSEEEKEGKPLRSLLGERLEQAARQLEEDAVGDPMTVARMQETLGMSLIELGHSEAAVPVLAKARDTVAKHLGPEDADTIEAIDLLGHAYRQNGNWDLAVQLDQENLRIRTAMFGRSHPVTLLSISHLAESYQSLDKLDLAIPLLEEALEHAKAQLDQDDGELLGIMGQLASCYNVAGNRQQAIELGTEVVRRATSSLGPEHHRTLYFRNLLARIYRTAGQPERAVPLLKEILNARRATLGPDQGETLVAINDLALSYVEAHKPELALPLFEEAHRARKTITTMSNLAFGYQAVGRDDLALPIFEETLQLLQASLGPDHRSTAIGMNNLAEAYKKAGKTEQALALSRQAANGIERLHFKHPQAGRIIDNVALFEESLKQYEEAENWRRKWLPILKEQVGAESTAYGAGLAGLGVNLVQQRKWVQAEPFLRQALGIRQRNEPDAWRTFNTQCLLGASLLGQERYAEAESCLLQGYKGLDEREDTVPEAGQFYLTNALEQLVQLYDALGQSDQAAQWRAKLNKRTAQTPK